MKLAEAQVARERHDREVVTRERAREEALSTLHSISTSGARKASSTPVTLSRAGGYQVDMLGGKRGACRKDSRCFRFEPPPPSPGSMLKGLLCARIFARTGERCGCHANEHDDLGSHQRGEPHLVDEKGLCYKISMMGGGGVHVRRQC